MTWDDNFWFTFENYWSKLPVIFEVVGAALNQTTKSRFSLPKSMKHTVWFCFHVSKIITQFSLSWFGGISYFQRSEFCVLYQIFLLILLFTMRHWIKKFLRHKKCCHLLTFQYLSFIIDQYIYLLSEYFTQYRI
jgi:hypothetical protein